MLRLCKTSGRLWLASLASVLPLVGLTSQAQSPGPTPKIGLNFGADQPNSKLNAPDVAGVPGVAQANWNNLSGQNGTNSTVVTDSGTTTAVTVIWDSNNTWASTGLGEENNQFTGADKILMTGYLDTGDATTSHVKIQGIPDTLTAATNGYDVYVYALGGVAAGRAGGYRILDATSNAVLKDYVLATSNTNPTNYVEVPQNLAAGVHGEGNYIVFRGLKASAIILEATTVSPQGSGSPPRAPVNAVQLVPAEPPLLFAFESSNNFPPSSSNSVHLVFTTVLSPSSIPNATFVIRPANTNLPTVQPDGRELINRNREIRLRISPGALITNVQYSVEASGLQAEENQQTIPTAAVGIVHEIKCSLQISRSGENVVITFITGTLQSADKVTDSFTNVAGATSPYTNSPPARMKFFRIKGGASLARLQTVRPVFFSYGQGLATSFSNPTDPSKNRSEFSPEDSNFGNKQFARSRHSGTWYFVDRIDQTKTECTGVTFGTITIAASAGRAVYGCDYRTDRFSSTVDIGEWLYVCVP
jgi:hypothetical protein